MAEHARLSPSSAHRWMRCPAALEAESTLPDRGSSSYADEGSDAHELGANTLAYPQRDTSFFLGTVMKYGNKVDQEMADHVQKYVEAIRDAKGGDTLHIEVKVDFSKVIDVPESFGTADAVIVGDTELQVHDLKYGMGVAVDAKDNEQLMLYALGALAEFDDFETIDTVTMGIHMPRKPGCTSDWTISKEELLAFGERAKVAAAKAVELCDMGMDFVKTEDYNPGEKQCKWCSYKAKCSALSEEMVSCVTDLKSGIADVHEFGSICEEIEDATSTLTMTDPEQIDNTKVARLMGMTGLMEGWIKAIRARVLEELEAGNAIPGYKLVRGRAGARRWDDAEAAEKQLKGMRLKVTEMYDLKLISPTKAEKLLKKTSPKRWDNLQTQIARSDGAIGVAPESDKRPAIELETAGSDEFDAVGGDQSNLLT